MTAEVSRRHGSCLAPQLLLSGLFRERKSGTGDYHAPPPRHHRTERMNWLMIAPMIPMIAPPMNSAG